MVFQTVGQGTATENKLHSRKSEKIGRNGTDGIMRSDKYDGVLAARILCGGQYVSYVPFHWESMKLL